MTEVSPSNQRSDAEIADQLADLLGNTGWDSSGDAQWSRLRDALPAIRALLDCDTPETAVMPAEADVLAWAVSSFGPIAQNIDERAARVAEEAIEIAQLEGVPLETIKRIADRIYSRPPGERWQEIGGTMIGLLSYAAIVGLTLSDCARREFDRVLSKPKDWWTKKHAEKVAAGTADLSPVTTNAPRPCVCGQPDSPGIVHRTDGPCYHDIDILGAETGAKE